MNNVFITKLSTLLPEILNSVENGEPFAWHVVLHCAPPSQEMPDVQEVAKFVEDLECGLGYTVTKFETPNHPETPDYLEVVTYQYSFWDSDGWLQMVLVVQELRDNKEIALHMGYFASSTSMYPS